MMPSCEKYWNDAHSRAMSQHKSITDCYKELLEERKDNPCSPREQAGDFWDEENQCDTRVKHETV